MNNVYDKPTEMVPRATGSLKIEYLLSIIHFWFWINK